MEVLQDFPHTTTVRSSHDTVTPTVCCRFQILGWALASSDGLSARWTRQAKTRVWMPCPARQEIQLSPVTQESGDGASAVV